MIYDIFYVSKEKVNDIEWQQFRRRFPSAQKIENVTSIDDVKKRSFTKFFWLVWDDIVILDNFNFDYRVEKWDEEYIHVFKNICNNVESYISGVALIPKKANILKKEFDFKFYVNKKEINIAASKFQYPIRYINSYEDYLNIVNTESKSMFWCVWSNTELINESILDMYFDPLDGKYDYDRSINHVFLNGCGDKNSYLNGVVLCSKSNFFTKKEFDRKYVVNKKEHDILVSRFRYPRYCINSYEEYLEICKKEVSPLFWCVWSDIEIINESILDMYFDPLDGKYDYDRSINHVFKNEDFYDGLMLMSKEKILSKKEFKFRFPIEKKEWDIKVSRPKPYDIIFISYNELNADENYRRLLTRFPRAKRIHGVKGIHQAHIAAANLSETEMFWVVDGDAVIAPDFNFSVRYYPHYDSGNRREHVNTVYVWHSKNPINGLVYGNGGVKLLPKTLTMNMDTASVDMTLAISNRFKIMSSVSNYNMFNTNEFTTWRSAFRECVKLSTKAMDEKYDIETDNRLNTWCTKGAEKPFGKYAIAGANAGVEFGLRFVGLDEILSKINDFAWLEDEFKKWKSTNE